MRFRKLLIATAAVAAAGAMALGPAAMAATPSLVTVGTNTSNTSHALTGVLKSASVNMQTAVGNVKLNCSGGSAAGTVNGGSFGTPPPNPVFDFTALSLNCDSFIPGTTVTMAVSGCDVTVDLTGVTAGVSTGTAHFANSAGKACVRVSVTGGCTLWIGGNVPVSFDNSNQHMVLNGPGASVYSNPAAPTFGCLGAVSSGSALTLNSVTFTLASPDGAISVS